VCVLSVLRSVLVHGELHPVYAEVSVLVLHDHHRTRRGLVKKKKTQNTLLPILAMCLFVNKQLAHTHFTLKTISHQKQAIFINEKQSDVEHCFDWHSVKHNLVQTNKQRKGRQQVLVRQHHKHLLTKTHSSHLFLTSSLSLSSLTHSLDHSLAFLSSLSLSLFLVSCFFLSDLEGARSLQQLSVHHLLFNLRQAPLRALLPSKQIRNLQPKKLNNTSQQSLAVA
jgi:hypothetical protein